MLPERSAALVRATLPALRDAMTAFTERFYGRLFAAHPSLLRDLFNRGNHAAGTQRQALAASFLAYATALTRPGSGGEDAHAALLRRVAHKHASVGVTAAQYTVVHTHLRAALAETLGAAATPAVLSAWDEVYWQMANDLIGTERRLYAERGVLLGDTWREWTVTGRTAETEDVITLRLRPADGRPAPAFRPGQYVSVRVQLPDGARQIRQYSLSSPPGPEERAITVKRVRGGEGPDGEVSGHLHAHAWPGSRLTLSAPFGDFVLGDTLTARRTPLLFATAGIGCTPVLPMLAQLVTHAYPAPVLVVHADRSPATHALRAEQRRLVGELPRGEAYFWYERPDPGWPADRTGRADLTALALPDGLHAYLCGPLPFLRAVRGQLLAAGVPASALHYEVFGPDPWAAAG
ncbi:globin domain-containing protein [Streptomyces sp. 7-21]|uniref:globin domain-containing protein n=1 Tax=Streptomyces sp. 7-21 TaxID=2802283 RepID=UPI00191FC1E8|nr:globin domain-containing protein [Streptomyces sp. 7-21]MBL1068923.1 hemin transporter [Streptomyces sp. 7-21]